MKRRKPTKKTNVVHSGWMTKSPPEGRLTSTFKIFRAQWKRRYFVLSKPQGSLPDQYELDYYKDEHCSNKKGSIDLEQCEQIIEALDSESFPNLLAIKTICRNKVRTYYLAADSEQEMNSWVQWLCHVCGLRPEDQPTDIPEPKPTAIVQPSISNGRPASPPTPITKTATAPIQSTQSASSISNQQIIKQTSSDSSSASYIPLENCTTGQPQLPADQRKSVDSMPDFLAPAPPQKHAKSAFFAPEDEVFLQDHVPTSENNLTQSSDLYQVPPARPAKGRKRTEDGPDSSYDIPPPRYEHSPRSSLDIRRDSGSGDGRAVTPECYDYPPPRLDSTTSSDSEIPPERPPKPSHLQSPYQNLPPAGKNDADLMNTVLAAPKQPVGRMVSGYDIPRSTHRPVRPTQSALATTVPPRQRGNANHNYFNTQSTRPNSGELNKSVDDHKPPFAPPPRHVDSGDDRSSSPSLYQYPPSSSSAPVPPSRPPNRVGAQGPSVMPRNVDLANAQGAQEDNPGIFSTQRTRSFKRTNVVNHGSPNLSQRTHALPMTSLVPAPRPVPQKPKEVPNLDDEDSIHSRLAHLDTEEETHHPISLLHSVPAPGPDLEPADRELKYIDLALPDSGQDTPRPAHGHSHHVHSHSHGHPDRGKEIATEYREIDFIKTQALSDAKKVKEKERKHDDHN
ncbi:hypothetical protein Btru_031510 [Bulinus truncatus]|nr:hypothetical protein Btru_031510 [Bulinus truncatus]